MVYAIRRIRAAAMRGSSGRVRAGGAEGRCLAMGLVLGDNLTSDPAASAGLFVPLLPILGSEGQRAGLAGLVACGLGGGAS